MIFIIANGLVIYQQQQHKSDELIYGIYMPLEFGMNFSSAISFIFRKRKKFKKKKKILRPLAMIDVI